ncbi:MAG TPA: hypothetical protein VHS28_02550, partial [Chloroflexota bacterium]|nr:hypothetical protein [Chloroflexota bacterium]
STPSGRGGDEDRKTQPKRQERETVKDDEKDGRVVAASTPAGQGTKDENTDDQDGGRADRNDRAGDSNGLGGGDVKSATPSPSVTTTATPTSTPSATPRAQADGTTATPTPTVHSMQSLSIASQERERGSDDEGNRDSKTGKSERDDASRGGR